MTCPICGSELIKTGYCEPWLWHCEKCQILWETEHGDNIEEEPQEPEKEQSLTKLEIWERDCAEYEVMVAFHKQEIARLKGEKPQKRPVCGCGDVMQQVMASEDGKDRLYYCLGCDEYQHDGVTLKPEEPKFLCNEVESSCRGREGTPPTCPPSCVDFHTIQGEDQEPEKEG